MMLQARPSAWGRIINFQYDTARPQTRPSKWDRSPIATAMRLREYWRSGRRSGKRLCSFRLAAILRDAVLRTAPQNEVRHYLILRRPRTEVGLARLRQP